LEGPFALEKNMRTVQLITTALGAATLIFSVAQAGPMGGGPSSGMGAPPSPASPSASVSGTSSQDVSADTCNDNAATRIPCAHHDKAKAKSKAKAAASADTSGTNASTSGAAKADTGPAAASTNASPSATTTTPPDSPH
jgi:hypothetical protein